MKVLLQATRFDVKAYWGVLFFLFSLLVSIVFLYMWSINTYEGRIIENVYIDSMNVSGLTPEQAKTKLQALQAPPEYLVELTFEEHKASSTSTQLGLKRDIDQSVARAFEIGRGDTFLNSLSQIISNLQQATQIESNYVFDSARVETLVQSIDQQLAIEGKEPEATLENNGTITIFEGKVGRQVDRVKTVESVQVRAGTMPISLSPVVIDTASQLSDDQVIEAKERAEQLKGKTITATADKKQFYITDKELISTLAFPFGYSPAKIQSLLQPISNNIARPSQDAIFEYNEETLEVTSFTPSYEGLEIDFSKTQEHVISALTNLEQSEDDKAIVEIALHTTTPNHSLAKTNSLGIQERIGFGESYYDHSIPGRIHNVAHASKIINNTIVKPGEEFSFNKALGNVSRQTGFQPAYVISGGKTVLGDGGGVCQVSTTLFRALLDSGLNITRRLPHSYRVSYYELNKEPGFDATVYSGNVDLRFINDSPNHVLLHFTTDSEKKYMTVEIFGTSDGRTTEISEYQKWGFRAPPAPQYFDDPSLPAGKLIQVDWAVSGINTKFTHTVKDKDGNVIRENEYTSRYIPWSAKYRRGTGV